MGRRRGRRREATMIRVEDIGRSAGVLAPPDVEKLPPLPVGARATSHKPLGVGVDGSLDGFSALGLHLPQTAAEEEALVEHFLSGLRKLFSADDNWAFLQQLQLSVDHCTRCQTCAPSCPVYEESGQNEIYRPTYRSESFRRLVHKHLGPGGRILAKLCGEDIDLNATTVMRLAELAYRCTLCRRCAQACPVGVDNGLIAHEIRKLLSMEMGIAPKELHEQGSM